MTAEQADDLCKRVASGGKNAGLAREFGISMETLFQYLHREPLLGAVSPLFPL